MPNSQQTKVEKNIMKHKIMRLVVEEFQTGQFTQAVLARRHGVSPASVCNWVRTLPRQPGKRGRKAHTAPTLGQQEMLRDVCTETFQAVATRHGVSRQFVHHLAKRWKVWTEQQLGPRCLEKQQGSKRVDVVKRVELTFSSKVISFRVPDSVVVKIDSLRTHTAQFRLESVHFIARELLLAGLGQGCGVGSSSDEPVQTEAFCVTS